MSDIVKDLLAKQEPPVPDRISGRVDQTLETLEKLPGRGKYRRAVQTAAVVFLLLGLTAGISMAFPSFAQNIPVLDSVFKYFYDNNDLREEYVKYSSGINQSATDKGITVTINEIVCDNSSLNIGYTVKSERKLERVVFPHAFFKVNGTPINVGGSGSGDSIDEFTYAGVMEYNIARISLPDEFNLDCSISSLGDTKGNWDFKFMVSKSVIEDKTVVFNTNLERDLEDAVIHIEKVSFTPLNTTIVFKGRYKDPKGNAEINGVLNYENWVLLDDKGKQIQAKGAGGGGENSETFTYEMHFDKVEKIPGSLTVIPFKYRGASAAERILGGTAEKLPVSISQGKIGSVTVDRIEFLENKTAVHIITEGMAPLEQATRIFFEDEEGKEIWRDEQYKIVKQDGPANEFTLDYPVLDKSKRYKLGTIDFDTYFDIREDLKFTIPLDE